MEFFNMGLIVLIISFDPTHTIHILRQAEDKSTFIGFEPKWYSEVGQSICSTIFLSAILTNVPEF